MTRYRPLSFLALFLALSRSFSLIAESIYQEFLHETPSSWRSSAIRTLELLWSLDAAEVPMLFIGVGVWSFPSPSPSRHKSR